MWFLQDVIDFPTRIKTYCHKNLPVPGLELVEIGYCDHLCWVSKSWWFGFGIFFGGWLGNNLIGSGHELVASGYLDHMCRFSKSWCFGPVNVVFWGLLGYYWNFIFRNAIYTWCRNNVPELEHDLVESGHFDQLCWVLKTWWVRLWRLGFGCWFGDFQKSIIFNIIFQGGNLILMEYMVNIFNELVKYRD